MSGSKYRLRLWLVKEHRCTSEATICLDVLLCPDPETTVHHVAVITEGEPCSK
jgi:hypothetical protein